MSNFQQLYRGISPEWLYQSIIGMLRFGDFKEGDEDLVIKNVEIDKELLELQRLMHRA